tara:strand:- start:458 stop:676 length:219 start_codon:yes stop_codon:yes gene_type:complete
MNSPEDMKTIEAASAATHLSNVTGGSSMPEARLKKVARYLRNGPKDRWWMYRANAGVGSRVLSSQEAWIAQL